MESKPSSCDTSTDRVPEIEDMARLVKRHSRDALALRRKGAPLEPEVLLATVPLGSTVVAHVERATGLRRPIRPGTMRHIGVEEREVTRLEAEGTPGQRLHEI